MDDESFPAVAEALAHLTEPEQQVALLRLMTRFNNGSEHFDHSAAGASWLCVACAREFHPR